MSRISLLLCAVLLGGLALGLLAGCGGGGGGEPIDPEHPVPASLTGVWAMVAYENNRPLGHIAIEVLANGDIKRFGGANSEAVRPSGLFKPAQVNDTVIGHVTNTDGAFTIELPDEFRITGDLDEGDTGSGSWQGSQGSGPVRLWRAAGTGAFTHDITVKDANGNVLTTGRIEVNANRIVIGFVLNPGGQGQAEIQGVITARGTIAAGAEIGGGVFVFITGTATATSASGTWQASNGEHGTWSKTTGGGNMDALAGRWFIAFFNPTTNLPVDRGYVQVLTNGDIMIVDDGHVTSTKVGRVTNASTGAFTIDGNVPMDEGGTARVTGSGTLQTDNTGTGTITLTYQNQSQRRNMRMWRASGTGSGTYNVVVNDAPGPVDGQVTIDADRLVTGTITVHDPNGQWMADLQGAATATGKLAAMAEGHDLPGGGDLWIFLEGNVTANSGSGTWKSSDNHQGTWTATRQ